MTGLKIKHSCLLKLLICSLLELLQGTAKTHCAVLFTQPVVFVWIVERASPQWRKEKKLRRDCEQPLLVRVLFIYCGPAIAASDVSLIKNHYFSGLYLFIYLFVIYLFIVQVESDC